ncbi:hypothetical protein, partial [Rhodococcus opacus]|uniref:hypothetical protein n=1 Tax=Rhodococcus opacus TaxID=37919 RepID=UPI003AF42347
HLTDKRIQLFPGTVESGCIHARMLSRKSRKLEPTRRANKVLLAPQRPAFFALLLSQEQVAVRDVG